MKASANQNHSPGSVFVLLAAQGFGLGRAPFAPGTFGTLGGLAWAGLLLWFGRFDLFLLLTVFGLGVSVWLSGAAEKILGERDPGSVVIDEIVAMPVCFLFFAIPQQGWTTFSTEWILTRRGLLIFVVGFGLFRLFDIWKPWPVRQSQNLPGGWGITVDDFLAAIYAGAGTTLIFRA